MQNQWSLVTLKVKVAISEMGKYSSGHNKSLIGNHIRAFDLCRGRWPQTTLNVMEHICSYLYPKRNLLRAQYSAHVSFTNLLVAIKCSYKIMRYLGFIDIAIYRAIILGISWYGTAVTHLKVSYWNRQQVSLEFKTLTPTDNQGWPACNAILHNDSMYCSPLWCGYYLFYES